MAQPALSDATRPSAVIALGKAAGPMLDGWGPVAGPALVIAPAGSGIDHRGRRDVEYLEAGHPVPTPASVVAAKRAIALARAVPTGGRLVVLLSGGASALGALPARGLTLEDKQAVTTALLSAGADIGSVNCVRKHLSAFKGGHLALACAAPVLTLAISDVAGAAEGDPSVIGSGPTLADPSTFAEAMGIVEALGIGADLPSSVMSHLRRGTRGEIPETPKPGDPRLRGSTFVIVGSRRQAMEAAARSARGRGYQVHVVDRAMTGEARDAAASWWLQAVAVSRQMRRPCCGVSSGETTVRVEGSGTGGRNQEFSLALVPRIAGADEVAVVSAGSDGVDGPTDAAGAFVDSTSATRARAAGLAAPEAFLRANDSFHFFESLGDLVRTGPTGTNVGDLQIAVFGPHAA